MQGNISKNNIRILILTGGSIPKEMEKVFGKIPSGLIPINGIPVIFKTIDNLLSEGYSKISIAVGYKKNKIIQILIEKYREQIDFEFIHVDYKLAPGNSIIESLKKIREKQLLVILGDTVIEKNLLQRKNYEKDFVLSSNNFLDSSKWCIIETKNGKIISIYEKENGIKQSSNFHALIGVYLFKDVKILRRVIRKITEKRKIEISQLLEEYNKIKPMYVVKSKNWFDVGHRNNYFRSKKELLQSRFFNFIELDEKNGVITKKSQDNEKLKSEIDWYKIIPQKIKSKTPKIISYNEKESNLVMEYVQFPTLAELWLYGDTNLKNWYRILEKLKEIIFEFNGESHHVKKQNYYQMYVEKTEKRINDLISQNSKFKRLFNENELIINGKNYKNWKSIKDKIFDRIESLFNENDNCLIHGDLCFSNILYNFNNNQYKLIDPRGKWGTTIFGDIKYDVAKLRHSIIGGYDSINNGLFSIKYEKSTINLTIYRPLIYTTISRKVDEWISEKWNLNKIKLIEGLLFISMLPLHQDNFKKQLAFYSIGIQRLNDVIVYQEKK